MTIAPPTVTITEAALEAFRGALGEVGAEDSLRLSIDARFKNELFFGPREASDVVVTTGGITLVMDPTTAKRANGVTIDFVDVEGGSGFKIENPNESRPFKGVRPADLRRSLASGERLELVDVRTEAERARAKVEAARWLDAKYEAALAALPKDTKLVFMAHHSSGGESVAQRFVDRGFTNVWYVVGGIDAWSTMDPSVPRY